MANETVDIRNKTRRVKSHILDRYLRLAEKVDKAELRDIAIGSVLSPDEIKIYSDLTDSFAKSVLPRTQEIGGDPDNQTPIPIYGGLSRHNSDQENIQPEEENKSS